VLRAALALLLCVSVAGCGVAGKTTKPKNPVGATLADLKALITGTHVAGAPMPANLDTTASLVAFMNVTGVTGASALFVEGAHFRDAGQVNVRAYPLGVAPIQVTLNQVSLLYQGTVEYAYSTIPSHPAGVAFPVDGVRFDRVSCAGNTGWPAFVDSVQSVPEPQISTPAVGEGVMRIGDLSVNWTDFGADSTVYVMCAVTSDSDHSHVAWAPLVRDTAMGVGIFSGDLVLLPAGNATLTVTRFRLVYHMQGARRVGLAAMGTALRHIVLI
jgi:hypothetical protein